jgi:hypothetical protein
LNDKKFDLIVIGTGTKFTLNEKGTDDLEDEFIFFEEEEQKN